MDWDTLIARFADHLRFERNMSANTVQAYTHDVEAFRHHAQAEPLSTSAAQIEAWMAHLFDTGVSAATQARMLSGAGSFFDFMVAEGLLQSSPVEFVDMPKVRRHLPDMLTLPEIDAMLASIDLSAEQGHRNRAIIETLYSCGLRVSELVTLRLGDIFFDDGFLRVIGKGDKQRLVPLSSEAQHQIELWMEQRRLMSVDSKSVDILFLNRRGRRLSRVMVFNIIKDAAAAAGIAKQVSPHTLRHSFATHLLEGGASIRQVQEMLGHESILTTEIYTHLDRTKLRSAIEKHHPLK